MDWRKLCLLATLCVSVGATGGCDQGPLSVGATGLVTFDGQPLPAGKIQFAPLEAKAGQRRDATIREGAFSLPDDEGLLPGMKFKVVIQAFRKTGRKYPNADMSASYEEEEQYLPAEYNSASTLQVTVSPDPAVNRFEFNLLSEPRSEKAQKRPSNF